MIDNIFSLIQPHTVRIYNLTDHNFTTEVVPARKLLTQDRFDLFAKIYYIEARERGDISDAVDVYKKHIKAFNPDLKEPGRSDKKTYDDFIDTFNELIETFRNDSFDDNRSIVPISENGVILDGAHRVAALAYFDKKVTVVRFCGVRPKCVFDYKYFINRGLSWNTADVIANTLIQWSQNMYVACLWPRIGGKKEKTFAIDYLSSKYGIAFEKTIDVNFDSLCKLTSKVYHMQPWTNDKNSVKYKALECYKKGNCIHFLFFKCDDADALLADKENIRNHYGYGKHSIHITDNNAETCDIAKLILTTDGMSSWYETSARTNISKSLKEFIFIFKNVYLLSFKVKVAKIINLLSGK